MIPKRKRKSVEKSIEKQLREELERKGWYTKKTHGSGFSKDWPDLFVCHPIWGAGWIELKKPKGKLSEGQIEEFLKMQSFGVKIWVFTSVTDIPKLGKEPNFLDYLMRQRSNIL